LAQDPLQPVYGDAAFAPWAPQLAAERFLAELRTLTKAAALPDAKNKLEKSIV
jgi:hypothetical protein